MSGQTIEVLNTDAARAGSDPLRRADLRRALLPKAVIDIATLTGACGCVGQSQCRLVRQQRQAWWTTSLAAGKKMNDRFWRMPLEEDRKRSTPTLPDMY